MKQSLGYPIDLSTPKKACSLTNKIECIWKGAHERALERIFRLWERKSKMKSTDTLHLLISKRFGRGFGIEMVSR